MLRSHCLAVLGLALCSHISTAISLDTMAGAAINSEFDLYGPAVELRPIESFAPAIRPPERGLVALLLPHSGPYEDAASRIADGFLGAYFDSPEPRPDVRIYDVGVSRKSMLYAYDHAVLDGASLIVGPLSKKNVQALADMRRGRIPVLALNYLDASMTMSPLFHQMGLAPEDEAAAAATSAIGRGLKRAIAVVGTDVRSFRIYNAFKDQYERLGGVVLDAAPLPPEPEGYLSAIRTLPGLDTFHSPQSSLAGGATDMIFIAVDADASRVLMPEFRFLRKTALPVFGTSTVFDRFKLSRDRYGLTFCDAPLLIQADGPLADFRNELSSTYEHSDFDQLRLIALGRDAFEVGASLASGDVGALGEVSGATGHLSIGTSGRIQRTPACATVSAEGLIGAEADR